MHPVVSGPSEALLLCPAATCRRSAVEGFQRMVPASAAFLLVNGQLYGTSEFNLYGFADLLRTEVGRAA